MANFINLSVTREGGDVVAAFTQLFDPEKMVNVRLNAAATGISFLYPNERKELESYESTSLTTTAALAAAVNLSAPSGTQTYIGVIDMAIVANRSIGTHDVLDINGNPLILPIYTRTWDGYYEVVTTFTSATDAGTIALGYATDSAAGYKAAIAISNGANPYDAAAPAVIIPVGTVAAITTKTTGARAVQYVVAVEALTAGKMYLFLECVTTPS